MTEAEEAAAHWGGQITAELRNRENAVYAMRLPDGRRAALRLHRLGYQTAAAIRSELWWCGQLAAAGLPIPAPLAPAGDDPLPALSTGRRASAVRWIDGAPFGEAGVPLAGTRAEQVTRHHALGRLLAQVHDTTDRLTLPADFTRPRWDIEGLVGETPSGAGSGNTPAVARRCRHPAPRPRLSARKADRPCPPCRPWPGSCRCAAREHSGGRHRPCPDRFR
ncbi:phosphotransferase enzyme family protein [Gemmobacter lanyuensis]